MLTTERYWKNPYSAFFLTFDKTVTITESRFPRVDVAKLFADLGGALGLWLVGSGSRALRLAEDV